MPAHVPIDRHRRGTRYAYSRRWEVWWTLGSFRYFKYFHFKCSHLSLQVNILGICCLLQVGKGRQAGMQTDSSHRQTDSQAVLQTELHQSHYLHASTHLHFLGLLCIFIWRDIALEFVLGVLHPSKFCSRYLAEVVWMRGEVSLILRCLYINLMLRCLHI